MPKVSVIMNCYNSDRFLKEAIDSIYAQTYENWEIVFWDNRSTDDSAAIAKSYDDRLRYFLADEFLPLYAARNKALEKARGEYIAFLDCDDEWLPEKLERQMKIFEEHSQIGFIYSNYYVVNRRRKAKKLYHRDIQPEGKILKSQCASYSIGLLTVIFRASLLNDVDEWFDISFKISGDLELFLRLLMLTDAYYIAEPLASYRIHGNNESLLHKEVIFGEYRYTASKFSSLYDSDNLDVRDAVNELAKAADIREAKLCLISGHASDAARLLKEHKNFNKDTKIMYYCSRLPGILSKVTYKILRKAYKVIFSIP